MIDFVLAILVVALSLGSAISQNRTAATYAEIFYTSGRIDQVQVRNSRDSYCPYTCRVNHRHQVHEIRWTCQDGDSCDHFRVNLVILPRDGEQHPGPAILLSKESREPDTLADVERPDQP